MSQRPVLLPLLTLAATAALAAVLCRAGGEPPPAAPHQDSTDLHARQDVGRPLTPLRETALSEEQSGQVRTDLRQQGPKANCTDTVRALDGLLASLATLAAALPSALPRLRLHALFCTWLT